MSVASFIRDSVFRPRLSNAGCLVVYDPKKLYLDVVTELADDQITVVDTSEHGIESREQALDRFVTLANLGANGPKELVVYVPMEPPKTDHDRVAIQHSAYRECWQ